MRSAISIKNVPAVCAGDQAAATDSQRLQAIGRMTGGVAHDFNNLLTVIMGVTEALAAELEDSSAQQELAVTGLRAAERGADLVRRLLAPSREQGRRPRTIDGAEMLDEIAPLVRQAIRQDVRLEVSQPAYPVCCIADHTDLTSALINLCMNGRDAMPFGGVLSLTVDRVMLSGRNAAALELRAGSYVVFTVRDNGLGMSPATLKQATQPFFTTKGEAGTGLGLANCHTFARESGGQLVIASQEGEGTEITLYLPAARVAGRAPAGVYLVEASNAR